MTESAQNSPLDRLDFSIGKRLPILFQAEAAECGLTCLAMIAGYYGHNTSLTELRRRFSVSLKGVDLKSLSSMADRLGFSTRALRLELDELKQLRTPCVLHWDLNHFVVLRKVSRNSITIHDPARGKRKISMADVSAKFTGVAMELIPTPNFVKKTKRERVGLMDMWGRMTGFIPVIFQLILISLVLQAFSIVSPLVNQLVVDEAIAKGDASFLKVVILGFAILLFVQTIIGLARSWIEMYFTTLLSYQMRSNMMRHILRLQTQFFEKRHIGDVMSRIGSLQPVQDLFTKSFVTVMLDGVLAVVTCIVMFLYSPKLALVVLGVVALSFIVRFVTFPYVLRMEEERIQKEADLESLSLETVRGIRAVKIFGREQERHSVWQNTFADTINVGLRLQRFTIISGASQSFVFGLLELGIYFLGAMLVINGELTLGMFFAFQSYRGQFATKVDSLVDLFFSFRTVGLHLERLADVVYAEQEKGLDEAPQAARDLTGKISVRNLGYRYGEAEPWIFRNIDFDINPGDRVALIGPSGGGKTTLLKLLIGLQPTEEGDILYDEVSLSGLGARTLRSQIGVVMQDDRLLSGSLYENISFFDPEMDRGLVEECARMADVDEDIQKMPMGYQSLIGDMGSSLSGGQIQRILLARALYAIPKMLFLDEGTANLDSESEDKIVSMLTKLPLTQVIVAHRKTAIAGCNRFFEVKDGMVTEKSAKEVLMTSNIGQLQDVENLIPNEKDDEE